MEIPAFYIQDAKVFPQDQSYTLMVVNYVLPQDDIVVRSHYDCEEGEEGEEQKVSEARLPDILQGNKYKFATLKLMHQTDKAIKEVTETTILDASKVSIEFSPNGEYLAILIKKKNILRVYKTSEDIESLIAEIDSGAPPLLEISGRDEMKKTKHLEFDMNSKYLVCFGLESLNVIDLEGDGDTFETF